MAKTDIVVIGGGPAGIVAAVNARRNNPTKKIMLVREREKSVVPCGIPYIFRRLDAVEKDVISDKGLEAHKISLLIDRVTSVDPAKKRLSFEKSKGVTYDKVIFATGSESTIIPIKGVEKKGVWHIKKDVAYLKQLRKAVVKSKNIVIIGGGFIGVELAEELSSMKRVTIIEKLDHCLITTFDEEFAVVAEEKLREKGVKIYTNTAVEEIGGNGKVEFVRIKNKKIPADLVILAIGARPHATLAKEAGLKLGKYGGIKVNAYMETSCKDIFAVGDCAETRSFFIKKYVPVMLASTASFEARIAAANLYKKEKFIKNKGTLAAFSTFVNGVAIGMAGLNEKSAKEEGFDIVIGKSEAPNHHPGTLPKTQTEKVKLIFSRTGTLLGGQIIGSETVGEMVNVLALAIQKKISLYDFDTLQIATHPLLTSAPTIYPFITAAQSALPRIKKAA